MDVMEKQILTESQIEQLAVEIRKFLLDHGMWQDVDIYYADKRMGCESLDDRHHRNSQEQLLSVEKGIDPRAFLEYANPDHILSMRFEGPVYDMLSYGEYPDVRRRFDAIFERYGLYYEFGNDCDFSCYYI